MSRRRSVTRAFAAPFALWGAALLVRPEQVSQVVCSAGPTPPTWLVRLLGGRLLAQHAAVLVHPGRGLVRAGVVVDTLHAVSMVAAGLHWAEYRRPAWVSAGTAAGAALAGALTTPGTGTR